MRVLFVIGTRPEAIKLAPVVLESQRRGVHARVCLTSQHREMAASVLDRFGIAADHDLDVMEEAQSPTAVAALVLQRLEPILRAETPDWLVVQGDTATVAAAALAGYYARVRVAHVEAGLRSGDKWRPFPEELNRRVAGVLADLHCAPTPVARQNLLREGVPEERVVVTGNPVIDALRWALEQRVDASSLRLPLTRLPSGSRLILVTAHRRESFGRPLEQICAALRDITTRFGDAVHVVFPVHPNPDVQRTVRARLAETPHLTLLPPVGYVEMAHLVKRAHIVLTDSGGLQEEAPALGKPVLVLRDVTERPEGIEAGTARLVGTERAAVVAEVTRLLEDERAYSAMAQAVCPYGDGFAAGRILGAIADRPS